MADGLRYNVIQAKNYAFAIRIVKLYKFLVEDKKERVLSKQLLRSGTSVGAMVEEAIGAESDADFRHKLKVAYKECRETNYWIRLLKDTEYLNEKQAESILLDNIEMIKILTKILKTTSEKTINS
jgi:four helix bundle protein